MRTILAEPGRFDRKNQTEAQVSRRSFLKSAAAGAVLGSASPIDESLKRLQTDHIDLMQMHEIIRLEDPDRIFSDGGAMEALVEAKQAGKIRYIGFTGHKDPFVHLRML